MEDGALEHGTNSTSSPLHPPIHKRIHAYFGQEIDGDSWRFILIALIIAFIAGMTMVQFSEDFPINVFAQPQQLFYLATPLDPDGSYRVIGTAFGCFVVAVLVVGQIAVQTGWRQKRGWLVGSAVVQTIGMIVAGSLRIKEPSYNMGLMLPEVAIMATVGGIQIATMRCLEGRVNKVNTIQFFGALVNMLIDKRLWKCKNPNRNIRALFILSVIGGASVGVWIYEAAFAAGGSGLTLLVCAFLKGTLVVGGLLLVPGKRGVDRSWKAATGKENTPYQGKLGSLSSFGYESVWPITYDL